MAKGWQYESFRHALSAKGIKSSKRRAKPISKLKTRSRKKRPLVSMDGTGRLFAEKKSDKEIFKEFEGIEPLSPEARALSKKLDREAKVALDKEKFILGIDHPEEGRSKMIFTDEGDAEATRELGELEGSRVVGPFSNDEESKNFNQVMRFYAEKEEGGGMFKETRLVNEGRELRSRDVEMKKEEVLEKMEERIKEGNLRPDAREKFLDTDFKTEAEFFLNGAQDKEMFDQNIKRKLDSHMRLNATKLGKLIPERNAEGRMEI